MKNTKKPEVVDYLFWLTLIFFTNPGGVLDAIYGNYRNFGIDLSDILFVILFLCFLRVWDKRKIGQDIAFNKIVKYLIIFLIYYVIVFAVLTPLFKNTIDYSILFALQKIRYALIKVFLVIFVYEFYLRSYKIFYKIFLISSIIIILLFLLSVITGIDILPLRIADRRFISIERILMVDYGLLPLLIPMGIVAVVFKFNIPNKNIIIIGALLMYLLRILAIFRRYIFGAIILVIIASILFNYIRHKNLIPLKKILKFTVFFVIILFVLKLTFPKYLDAGILSAKETIHIIQYGESLSGKKDVRMGLGKDIMQNLIKENVFFGTGFDNRWRTGVGDRQGFEAADYPMLAAIAMTGVFGLFMFLPIYIVLIKIILFDIKYLRKHQYNVDAFDTFVFITFILYYLYDLLQYINLFGPVSLISHRSKTSWYILLAFYLASRKIFYTQEKQNLIKGTTN